jgi:hypothetical protein
MMFHRFKLRARSPFAAIVASSLLAPSLAYADVTYQETTQITGGSMVGMLKMVGIFSSQAKALNKPILTTVMIHGNRMVRSSLHVTQIVDLDKKTITMIDNDKHTYSVTTFQEFEQRMSMAMNQTKGNTASDSSQMTFDVHVTKSGATQQIDAKTATESLLTVTMKSKQADPGKSSMAGTSEFWTIDNCPGLPELRAFKQRLAKELAAGMQESTFSNLMASQPGGEQAAAALTKESTKIPGFPVLEITRFGFTTDGQPLPAPSVAPLNQGSKQGPSTAAAVTKDAAAGTATQTASDQAGRLGSFGRALSSSTIGALSRHKPQTASPTSASAASTPDATAGILIETRSQMSGFSTTPVDPTAFAVPAGYKAVASPMQSK